MMENFNVTLFDSHLHISLGWDPSKSWSAWLESKLCRVLVSLIGNETEILQLLIDLTDGEKWKDFSWRVVFSINERYSLRSLDIPL